VPVSLELLMLVVKEDAWRTSYTSASTSAVPAASAMSVTSPPDSVKVKGSKLIKYIFLIPPTTSLQGSFLPSVKLQAISVSFF
jgi:hypothetical protein